MLESRHAGVPECWIDSLTFSDGTKISLNRGDVVVIVGPNNSGKSATLRSIRSFLCENSPQSPVVCDLSTKKRGTTDELLDWIRDFAVLQRQPDGNDHLAALGVLLGVQDAKTYWNRNSRSLGQLGRFFCHMLTTDERLTSSNSMHSIALLRDAPQHPIHNLLLDDNLEKRISQQFRRAFGQDLIVHRSAGGEVPLLVGKCPTPQNGDDRVSVRYIKELNKLGRLQSQGDGMRSFASMLLFTIVGRENILLVDEPEAFLHPPQARMIGQRLVADKPVDRQVFISTHSGDVIRGVLDANMSNVRVIRIRREGDVNVVRELDSERIRELWKDPLLRYSNILDGLFHESVVVCESDADAQFYSAVMNAVVDDCDNDKRRPDIMFMHCGGKDRLPLVMKALRAVDVPTKVVADFDMLKSEHPLGALVEASGATWKDYETDWRLVKTSVESKRASVSPREIESEIASALKSVTDSQFPRSVRNQIEAALKKSSPWSIAKTTGRTFVPSGDPMQSLDRLLCALRLIGVWIVDVGEVEGFVRSVGGHGPTWVNSVLSAKNLANDDELELARRFVMQLVES